jgi:hypothetical protein
MILYIFSGLNKGKPVTYIAPDVANAQTMVDANTKLLIVGEIFVKRNFLEVQGEFNALKVYEATKF